MIATLAATAAVCHIFGTGAFTAPDSDPGCTPGSHVRLKQAQVCTPTDRPSLRASVRRDVLARYGLTSWSGRDGELDHRIPWFLTHDSSARNIWPERGQIPNPKDKLEAYVWRRVCHGAPYPMRVKTARIVFQGDWTAYYRKWFGDG